jgi:hypothetical protein
MKYKVYHIPTREIIERTLNSELASMYGIIDDSDNSIANFHKLLCKWNEQQPETWLYCPIE